jgi:uncharacterized membrane protein YdjX (TVP38/TMEM64 family)
MVKSPTYSRLGHMPEISKAHYRRLAEIGVFIAAFITASVLAHRYESTLMNLLGDGGVMSMAVFVFLTAFFVVFVIPLDIVFLIPIGTTTWGPVATALMSILGWVTGASIAFWIARARGVRIVSYLIGDARVAALRERIPQTGLFWSIVFLRMLIPVDLLSYALGLFTHMPWHAYMLATAIGVSPFGFFFAYAGTLPPWYQAAALLSAFALVTVILWQYHKSHGSGGGQIQTGEE